MADLTVTVYGGAAVEHPSGEGEIGGNRVLLEWDGGRWFCDFGMRFKAHGRFYEEFLKPRTPTCGLRDYLRMGILPPLEGLYRDDLTAHEPDLWDRYRDHPLYRRVDEVDGVLVSHAHLDHNGNVGFLRPDVPIYTGLTSAVTAKAMEDTRAIGPENELCYLAPREDEDGVLKTSKAPRLQRRHVVCEDIELTDELQEFWCSIPASRTELDHCPLERWQDGSGLRFWRVDHSIPGSGSFGIETPAGWVIYSGDVRRHGHSSWRVDRFVEEARALRPVLLIVEGTRAGEEGNTKEGDVQQAADEVVGGADGLVIADFAPRNIERLRTFHDVAASHGRQLVVTVQDAYLLEQLHRVDPAIPDPSWESTVVLRKPEGGSPPLWKRGIYDRFAQWVVEAEDIRRDPGAFVMCLSFWDISTLIDLEPDGGRYVYSSAEAFTEEMAIDQRRLAHWLDHFGLERFGGLPGAEEGPFHASGHADGPALQALIDEIAPERILPVHTENLKWFTDRWGAKVIVAAYGGPVTIS